MRISATFSEGIGKELDGKAIGDEFQITGWARIVGAEEALIDVTSYGESDVRLLQGDMEVKLLIRHAHTS